jgi:hypothetical protein
MNHKCIKFLILPCVLLLFNCSTYKQSKLEIEGDARECFNKKDVDVLIDSYFQPGDDKIPYLQIWAKVVNESKCIGVYKCMFTGKSVSNVIVLKVLKFEDKVYMFDEDNIEENEKVLNEFIVENKHFFTETDLEKLIVYFKKGTEYRGSFF